MMPEAWPSIRSMARCVLPVFVGPRTAFTRAGKPESRPCMDRMFVRRGEDCKGKAAGDVRAAVRHPAGYAAGAADRGGVGTNALVSLRFTFPIRKSVFSLVARRNDVVIRPSQMGSAPV